MSIHGASRQDGGRGGDKVGGRARICRRKPIKGTEKEQGQEGRNDTKDEESKKSQESLSCFQIVFIHDLTLCYQTGRQISTLKCRQELLLTEAMGLSS